MDEARRRALLHPTLRLLLPVALVLDALVFAALAMVFLVDGPFEAR